MAGSPRIFARHPFTELVFTAAEQLRILNSVTDQAVFLSIALFLLGRSRVNLERQFLGGR